MAMRGDGKVDKIYHLSFDNPSNYDGGGGNVHKKIIVSRET